MRQKDGWWCFQLKGDGAERENMLNKRKKCLGPIQKEKEVEGEIPKQNKTKTPYNLTESINIEM